MIFCNAAAHPDSTWVAQQARNAAWELQELEIAIMVLMHDRDSKYGSDFDAVKGGNSRSNSGGPRVDVVQTPEHCLPRSN